MRLEVRSYRRPCQVLLPLEVYRSLSRYCFSTVEVRFWYRSSTVLASTVLVLFKYCFSTVIVLFKYCRGTVLFINFLMTGTVGTSICNCARAEVTWAFTVCAKAHDFSVAAANDYTGARTVVRSWRARRRAVAAAMAHARQDLRIRIPSISCVSQGAIVEEGLGGGGGGGGGSGGATSSWWRVPPPNERGVVQRVP